MATFLAFMTLLTAIQVLLRYGFNTGLIWSLEATTYSFAWLVLLGMAWRVQREKTRIARHNLYLIFGLCLLYPILSSWIVL